MFVSTMALKFKIKANGNVAQMRLLGDISSWSNNSADFTRQIDLALQAGATSVKMYMATFGGDTFEANEIKNQIKRFPGTKTVKLGAFCCSAGTSITQAFDEIIGSLNTMLMIHNPAGGAYGDVKKVTAFLELLKIVTADYVTAYSKQTGIPEAEITAMMDAETWMNAATALEKGFIDDIDETPEEETDMEGIEEIYASFKKYNYTKVPTSIAAYFEPLKNDNQITTMNKVKIIAMLAVAGVMLSADSTDAQVEAAVDALAASNKRLTEDLDAEKKKTIKSRAKMITDGLLEAKKITAAEYDSTLADAEANPDMVVRMYSKVPAPVKATENIGANADGNATGEDRSRWTWDDWKTKDSPGLNAKLKNDEKGFNELYKAKFGQYPS